ncbi:MAG: hypothetical protein RL011_83 [Pseudomonadota bacterium]|jgi:hypothetical protein
MQSTLHFCAALVFASGCGNVGESPATSCDLCGTYNDVSGVVSSAEGSLSAMQGWVVTTIERDTGIARVEPISNNAGKFKFKKVRTNLAQTLALLSPNYRLQAVLSMPGTDSKNLRQWLRYNTTQLPKLINAGNILKFTSTDGLDIQGYTVPAQQSDQELPTGVSKLGLTRGTRLASPVNLLRSEMGANSLGLLATSTKTTSPDYNNNGIVRWLDPYDGDKEALKLDMFATGETSPKQVFNNIIKYFTVQVSKSADEATQEKLTYLNFSTQLLDGLSPTPTVYIRGSDSLMGKSLITLTDDGSGTKTYTGQAKVATTATINTFDVLFLELKFGSDSKAWMADFPWVFSLDLSSIPAATDAVAKSAWDSGNLVVTNPFTASGSTDPLNSFTWNVSVYSDSTLIWTAPSKLFDATRTATNATITVPKAVFNFASGATYKYSVSLQSDDQIPGTPSYVVQSLKFAITAP